jgi:hypothetical protein
MISTTYVLRICWCPVRVPSRFWARERCLDNSISMRFVEPTVFALARRVSGPAQKQAADLTPQLTASPSDHEQGNT